MYLILSFFNDIVKITLPVGTSILLSLVMMCPFISPFISNFLNSVDRPLITSICTPPNNFKRWVGILYGFSIYVTNPTLFGNFNILI